MLTLIPNSLHPTGLGGIAQGDEDSWLKRLHLISKSEESDLKFFTRFTLKIQAAVSKILEIIPPTYFSSNALKLQPVTRLQHNNLGQTNHNTNVCVI